MKQVEVRLVSRFRFTDKVEGSHQNLLYRAIHAQTNQHVFLKGQDSKSAKIRPNSLTIMQQGKILQSTQGGIGIPYMYWCGQQQDYAFIVLEELGDNMQTLLKKCNGKFTLKTVLMLGIELVNIIQYFHLKQFAYNNLNPRNIMLGQGNKYNKIFLTDYSKANRYLTQPQVDRKQPLCLNYNAEFSGLRYHQGQIPSRKDDMESLLLLMLYFLKGELPWSKQARAVETVEQGRQLLAFKIEAMDTAFKDYPQLQKLYEQTKRLDKIDKPHYPHYQKVFVQMLQKQNELDDKIYDWMLLFETEQQQINYDFSLIDNEEEYLRNIQQQILTTKYQLSGQVMMTDKNKEKQCIIY